MDMTDETFDLAHMMVMEDGCPLCGSEDLGCCGLTGERTDLDITDVVECHDCDWSIVREAPSGTPEQLLRSWFNVAMAVANGEAITAAGVMLGAVREHLGVQVTR